MSIVCDDTCKVLLLFCAAPLCSSWLQVLVLSARVMLSVRHSTCSYFAAVDISNVSGTSACDLQCSVGGVVVTVGSRNASEGTMPPSIFQHAILEAQLL